MIRKTKGEFVVECNECGAEAYGGIEERFMVFLDEIKKEGWKARKDGEEWEHYCENCSDEID